MHSNLVRDVKATCRHLVCIQSAMRNNLFGDSNVCRLRTSGLQFVPPSWFMTRRCFSMLQRCAISGKRKSTEISSIDVAAFQTQPLLPIGCRGYKYHCKGSAVQASRCLANMIGSLREMHSASLRSYNASSLLPDKNTPSFPGLGTHGAHMGNSRRVSAW
jgi:hypothetical protein